MRRTFAVTLLAGVMTLLGTPAQADDGYLNATVQALQQGNVYVSPEVANIDASVLREAIGSSDIVVAVVPSAAAEQNGGTVKFLSTVASGVNHETVIIAAGNDIEAGSRVLPAGKAGEIANDAESNTPDTNAALVAAIDGIQSYSSRGIPQERPAQTEESGGGLGMFMIVSAIVTMLLVVGGYFISRMGKGSNPHDELAPKLSPEQVQAQLVKIRALRDQITDPEIKERLKQVIIDTEQYFARSVATTKPERERESKDFSTRLTDGVDLLTRYVDVQNFPGYYDDPAHMIESGKDAVDGLAEGVRNAIKKGTTRGTIDFLTTADIMSAERYR